MKLLILALALVLSCSMFAAEAPKAEVKAVPAVAAEAKAPVVAKKAHKKHAKKHAKKVVVAPAPVVVAPAVAPAK